MLLHVLGHVEADHRGLVVEQITDADKDTPNWKLYFALRGAVAHQLPHDQARYRAAAFTSFRTEQELKGEATDIALRWLRQSGLA
ncbi:hypothetical protein BSZ22_02630 [Bradyrhizobium canariense]|uniref:Uncharacterized protein n=1 Tax=Bradyrhizobium canariense TaxID=255045 RepID=A0A1X3HEM8_9BRAD|nr:hypothetical protein BSZ22_02630 [Bradyrhizobium canariense]OSI82210.1 hypothetical protein BSZ23_02635 [Bradyrhizobium canariense]OSJ18328.1 hypothetical protein BSZ18_02405 [Bradyrhizobium canariense]